MATKKYIKKTIIIQENLINIVTRHIDYERAKDDFYEGQHYVQHKSRRYTPAFFLSELMNKCYSNENSSTFHIDYAENVVLIDDGEVVNKKLIMITFTKDAYRNIMYDALISFRSLNLQVNYVLAGYCFEISKKRI